MADQSNGNIYKNIEQELKVRSLYTFNNFQFVIPEPVLRGSFDIVKADQEDGQQQDAIKLEIKTNGTSKIINLLGGKGWSNPPEKLSISGLDFNIQYGSLKLELPFSIKLNDFIAEKYPGTEKSYSSFMSKIEVEDSSSFTSLDGHFTLKLKLPITYYQTKVA